MTGTALALYWGGLIATVVATVVITRISRQALQTALGRAAPSPADDARRSGQQRAAG